jgi:hypothetical protein
MMPHPATMPFAWEEEVLRCTRIIVCIFVLGIIALIATPVVFHHAAHSTPVAAYEGARP